MQRKDDTVPIYKKSVLPDHELLLWEKWVQIRSEETKKLGKKLNRTPIDLTMNLLSQVREDKERKVALEHAQLEKKTGVRGALWDRPPRLKQHCYCEPAYELRRTLAEKGRPPVIEHVGVPNYIQETEMGMTGARLRKRYLLLDYEYENYRDQREDDLHDEIQKVDPFRPNIKGLLIKGNKPPDPPPKIPPLPVINVENAISVLEEPLNGVYAMKINNTVFFKDIPDQNLVHVRTFQEDELHEACTAWTYYFNVPIKKAGRSKLFIQNLGTVTLRYCWKKIKQITPFIPEDAFEQLVFFFNKNEDVISPGQSKEIFFTFVSDKPGIYSESWELSVSNVNFFDTIGEKLSVHLFADSVEDVDKIKRKVEVLKTRIHRKSISNLASEVLEEIFDKVFEVVPQVYPYEKLFLEEEMFILKNPVCFYHQTEVAKMNELYTEMVPKKQWDLSIATWRQTMMAKEYDDRMKYYDLLRKSHKEFLKPWYEGDGLLKEKYRAVKFLLGKWADKFDSEYASVTDLIVPKPPEFKSVSNLESKSKLFADPIIEQMVRNILFLRIYEHLETTMELCAGILSSLDLNRWIDFDFCRH